MPFELTPEELSLVTNANILKTKTKIISNVYDLFGDLAEGYAEVVRKSPQDFSQMPGPKISRGEQYGGLPFVMLDFPRIFQRENIFAIRCLFWWGNFFSITLQLGGKYQENFAASISRALIADKLNDWFICVADQPWDHHFETNNYLAVKQFEHNKIHALKKLPFIKVAKKIPLFEWEKVSVFYKQSFNEIMDWLQC